MIKICRYCGEEFEAKQHNSAYCSDECRKEAGRILNRNNKAQRKREKNTWRSSYKGKSIAQLTKEATEAGMTYGQYVAKLDMERVQRLREELAEDFI